MSALHPLQLLTHHRSDSPEARFAALHCCARKKRKPPPARFCPRQRGLDEHLPLCWPARAAMTGTGSPADKLFPKEKVAGPRNCPVTRLGSGQALYGIARQIRQVIPAPRDPAGDRANRFRGKLKTSLKFPPVPDAEPTDQAGRIYGAPRVIPPAIIPEPPSHPVYHFTLPAGRPRSCGACHRTDPAHQCHPRIVPEPISSRPAHFSFADHATPFRGGPFPV